VLVDMNVISAMAAYPNLLCVCSSPCRKVLCCAGCNHE